MKRVKLFEQFIVESQQETLIDKILVTLEDDIINLVIKYETSHIKKYNKELSSYDKKLIRFMIIADFVRSIEKYTLETDSLIICTSSISRKGNLEISAQIKRDDVVYFLNTEVIYAGGYNIQTLHYRYITKTDLPKTGNTKITDEWAVKIKKLTKYEKLNKELQEATDTIELKRAKIAASILKSEIEILEEIKANPKQYMYGEWPEWKEIVKRGADKNFDYSEDKYNAEKEEDLVNRIAWWKKKNIDWPEQDIKELQKRVNSITKKINEINI